MATRIPLYKGKGALAPVVAFALVDDDDYALVTRAERWHPRETAVGGKRFTYACCNVRDGNSYRTVWMHRLVMGVDGQSFRQISVDHRDGDGLNNTRANLRICTHAENMQNRRQYVRKARFRGVQQLPSGRWRARYGGPGSGGQVHIGAFDTELEAAIAAEEYRKAHAPFAEPDPALAAAIGE